MALLLTGILPWPTTCERTGTVPPGLAKHSCTSFVHISVPREYLNFAQLFIFLSEDELFSY